MLPTQKPRRGLDDAQLAAIVLGSLEHFPQYRDVFHAVSVRAVAQDPRYVTLARLTEAPTDDEAAAVAADAFGAPPTPVLKQDIKQAMPPQADAGPKAPAPAAATAEAPAPVAEAPAAATATAEVPAPATAEAAAPPKPSPTKKPSIKPVMPGGRKKSKNNKKKKKGSKK